MVGDLRGKYKRNKIFLHTTRQSGNHARALQVDRELYGCPSINYSLNLSPNFNFQSPLNLNISLKSGALLKFITRLTYFLPYKHFKNQKRKFWKIYRTSYYRLNEGFSGISWKLKADNKEKRRSRIFSFSSASARASSDPMLSDSSSFIIRPKKSLWRRRKIRKFLRFVWRAIHERHLMIILRSSRAFIDWFARMSQ